MATRTVERGTTPASQSRPSDVAWIRLTMPATHRRLCQVCAGCLFAFGAFLQLGDHLVEVEAGGFLPGRELGEGLEHLGPVGLRRDGHECVIKEPVVVGV